jgi:hypothetical protein
MDQKQGNIKQFEYQKKFWKENNNWAIRYLHSSFDLSRIMCGMQVDKKLTMWKPKAIKEFNEYMKKNSKEVKKTITLYRGTSYASPTVEKISEISVKLPFYNCQYLSCSKSKEIGLRYKWDETGFLHILHCHKGSRIYDMENEYNENFEAQLEKEVIILPNHRMKIRKINDHVIEWDIYGK